MTDKTLIWDAFAEDGSRIASFIAANEVSAKLWAEHNCPNYNEIRLRSKESVPEPPRLLRVPEQLHSVKDVLATAEKLNLANVVVLSEGPDGGFVFLSDSKLNAGQVNFLLDKVKHFLMFGAGKKEQN